MEDQAEFMHAIPKYGTRLDRYYELIKDEHDKYGFWVANRFDLGTTDRLPNFIHNDLINPSQLEPLTKRQYFKLKKEALRLIAKAIPEDPINASDFAPTPIPATPTLAAVYVPEPKLIDKVIKVWKILTTTSIT